jgi:hypothetical protein
MTTTPESWDDVGSLRLEVNSISLKVQDVQAGLSDCHGLNDLQLQKLRQEIAQEIGQVMTVQSQEQTKERCKMKVCIFLMCALLVCVFMLQLFIICTGSSGELAQRLYKVARGTPADDFQFRAAEASTVLSVTKASNEELKNQTVQNGLLLTRRPADDVTADENVEVELLTAEQNATDGAVPAMDVDQPQNSTMSVHTQSDETIVQSLDDDQFSHGIFWVCFPPKDFKRNLRKYSSVFEKMARSQKWRINAYCWLDTRKAPPQVLYEERLCNDVEKVTFSLEMEKKSTSIADAKDSVTSPRDMPHRLSFDACTDLVWADSQALFEMKSPAKFQQVYPAGQDITASLVEEFIDDVHHGKIRQIVAGKRDLRRLSQSLRSQLRN